ncbi:MAG TPA: hypothetical protein VHT53_11265 [Candidatus Elarobacter sp.]|nr:hypothetical protein [Candidatus Elarobacter sp.]
MSALAAAAPAVASALALVLLLHYLGAAASGWRGIRRRHPEGASHPGQTFARVFTVFGAGVRSRSYYARVFAGDDGVHIRAPWYVRPFHSPLAIPWSSITSMGGARYLQRDVETFRVDGRERLALGAEAPVVREIVRRVPFDSESTYVVR